MKTIIAVTFFLSLGMITAGSSALAQDAADFDAEELIRQIETQYQGKTSRTKLRMKIVTEAWSRDMVMESWSEGRDKFLAVILEPKKEEGTATLKINDDMWNYLPKIDRLMKIPSSLMGDSWMGSHLTNDDLVKENKIDELYTFETESVQDSIVSIVCTPKPDAAIVWGKVVYKVDITKNIPVIIEYYDEDDELVRTMEFGQVEYISGRWIPMKMTVHPIDKPDEVTELIYEDLEFDVQLPANLFSITSLRRR